MKHLISFRVFLEKVEVKDTDPAHIKLAKDQINSIESKLAKYPEEKKKVDQVYQTNKDKPETEIYKKALDTLGKEPKNRNDFAVDYAEVANLNKEIKNLTDKLVVIDSDVKVTSQNVSLAVSPEAKKDIQTKLTQMQQNRSTLQKKLEELKKKLDKSNQSVNQKMIKTQKEIADASKKLSEKEKK